VVAVGTNECCKRWVWESKPLHTTNPIHYSRLSSINRWFASRFSYPITDISSVGLLGRSRGTEPNTDDRSSGVCFAVLFVIGHAVATTVDFCSSRTRSTRSPGEASWQKPHPELLVEGEGVERRTRRENAAAMEAKPTADGTKRRARAQQQQQLHQ
jgi:hypothetical protein